MIVVILNLLKIIVIERFFSVDLDYDIIMNCFGIDNDDNI